MNRLTGLKPLAGLTKAGAVSESLKTRFDDVPDFDELADPEVDTNARLSGDRSHVRLPTRRLFVDYRANPDARQHVERLPGEGESIHGIVCGKYCQWDIVPALIDRTGRAVDELTIATLSYSKSNAAELIGLLDKGHIRRVSLLISYFFKAQNRPLYDSLVPALRDRGMRVLAMRTHIKLLLIEMAGGAGEQFVVEGSANLRSSKNVEGWIFSRDARLYEFHHRWVHDELLNGREEGEADGD